MSTIEIERKFLVKNIDFLKDKKGIYIVQGYLNTDKNRTVRIRIKGDKAFITIKGISSVSGMSRFEWEKEIDIEEAETLLSLCEPYPVYKNRYEVDYKGFVYEVDVFQERHKGLVLAEIELNSEDQLFDKPDWLGDEITGDKRYYNSYLSKKIES